jgi:acetyltransferase-like isoleucine patch superfamily enzyme
MIMKFNNKYTIGQNVKLGQNVRIGDNSVIYDNVEIGDDTIIGNDCVIGEPLFSYYSDQGYSNPKTVIGDKSLIRSHSIIYSGTETGIEFQTGHRVTIREKAIFGNNCSVGTLSDIQGHVKLGNYCRLHSNVHIGQKSEIGDFVFIYPYVVLTNDPTPPSDICIGPKIGSYSQIATMSVILPGVIIGEHALIGAGSIVAKNVSDYSLTLGNPAKHLKDVREIKSRGSEKSHYPWPYNFDRGMPWRNIGFDKWNEDNET